MPRTPTVPARPPFAPWAEVAITASVTPRLQLFLIIRKNYRFAKKTKNAKLDSYPKIKLKLQDLSCCGNSTFSTPRVQGTNRPFRRGGPPQQQKTCKPSEIGANPEGTARERDATLSVRTAFKSLRNRPVTLTGVTERAKNNRVLTFQQNKINLGKSLRFWKCNGRVYVHHCGPAKIDAQGPVDSHTCCHSFTCYQVGKKNKVIFWNTPPGARQPTREYPERETAVRAQVMAFDRCTHSTLGVRAHASRNRASGPGPYSKGVHPDFGKIKQNIRGGLINILWYWPPHTPIYKEGVSVHVFARTLLQRPGELI